MSQPMTVTPKQTRAFEARAKRVVSQLQATARVWPERGVVNTVHVEEETLRDLFVRLMIEAAESRICLTCGAVLLDENDGFGARCPDADIHDPA